jgi:hypothetical protein
MTARTETLVAAICPDPSQPLATALQLWCRESRAFLAFAQANLPKLRKKARGALGEGAQADLQAELAVAAWLLRGSRTVLRYEPLKAGGGRGPDYALELPGGPVYVEVARLRAGSQAPAHKLARVLADKAGQLPPGALTVLAAVLPPSAGAQAAPDTQAPTDAQQLAPAALRLLAQAGQGSNFPGVSPESARAFERRRPRLGGVLCLTDVGPTASPQVTFWAQVSAAHPLSAAAVRLLSSAPPK